MDLEKMFPIVLYDNQCYLCTKFAKVVSVLSRRKIFLVGHYTQAGEKLRNKFLDSSALDMFWFIDSKTAFGGRAALFPLIKLLFQPGSKNNTYHELQDSCDTECKTVKAVFIRSASLFTNSKKIKIYNINKK